MSAFPFPNGLPLGLILLDQSGTILTASDRAAALLGLDPCALSGKSFFSELASLPGMVEAHEGFRREIGRDGVSLRFATSSGAGGRSRDASRLLVCVRSFRDGDHVRALVVLEEAEASSGEGLDRLMEVASGVRHEVNNLLMGLLGHAALLRESTELPEALRERVAMIEQQGRRIRDRIADLDDIRHLPRKTR